MFFKSKYKKSSRFPANYLKTNKIKSKRRGSSFSRFSRVQKLKKVLFWCGSTKPLEPILSQIAELSEGYPAACKLKGLPPRPGNQPLHFLDYPRQILFLKWKRPVCPGQYAASRQLGALAETAWASLKQLKHKSACITD